MSRPVVDRLANGLTTVLVELPASHQVLVTLMVRTGSRFEQPAQAGITHFLEHMLFRGNTRYPDENALNLAFEEVGGAPNANTGVESTEFYFVAHPDRLGPALERLAALVRSPTFAALEKERSIIRDEILYDYNERGDLIDLPTLAAGMLWRDHPLGHAISGTPETVGAITAAHLRNHHRENFYPANIVLALVGNLRPEVAAGWVNRCFGDWESPTLEPRRPLPAVGMPDSGPVVKTVADPDNQFHLQLSFPTPGYNAPEDLPLAILSRVLDDGPSSLLQRIVREERALAYSVSGGCTGYQDAGQFDISTSVKAERLEEMLACLFQVLAGFREQGPSADDLEHARRRHRFDLEFGRDAPSAWVDRHAWPLLFSTVRDEAEELELVAAITPADLQALAVRLFARSRLHLAVVGPLDPRTEDILWRALQRF